MLGLPCHKHSFSHLAELGRWPLSFSLRRHIRDSRSSQQNNPATGQIAHGPICPLILLFLYIVCFHFVCCILFRLPWITPEVSSIIIIFFGSSLQLLSFHYQFSFCANFSLVANLQHSLKKNKVDSIPKWEQKLTRPIHTWKMLIYFSPVWTEHLKSNMWTLKTT